MTSSMKPKISIGSSQRRDGRWHVTLSFPGAPNAFGGNYPSRFFAKIYTHAQLLEAVAKYGDADQRQRFGVKS